MKGNLSDTARLKHILDAISEIENYINNIAIDQFTKSSVKKYATVKQLEIIGEAANRISRKAKLNHPEVECLKLSHYGIF